MLQYGHCMVVLEEMGTHKRLLHSHNHRGNPLAIPLRRFGAFPIENHLCSWNSQYFVSGYVNQMKTIYSLQLDKYSQTHA